MTEANKTPAGDINWKRYWELVDSARSIVLTSHVRPDGDSLGSQTAMAMALKARRKQVMMINADPVPPTLTFLDPRGEIRALGQLTGEEKKFLDQADLLVALDTSSKAQLGAMYDYFAGGPARKAVIDHHVQRYDFQAELFADSDAPATGTIVFDALRAGGIELTGPIAFALFTAIATDTGWFRFSSVTDRTFETAAALIRAGIRPDDLYRTVYEHESLGRIRLIGRALAKTEPFFDGRLMLTSILQSDFAEAGAHPSESEDIVNETLKIAGTKMALILIEQKNGDFKVSFRSRCSVDCSRLAASFGGGGHASAAGATLKFSYEETKKRLLDSSRKALEACGE